MIHCLPGHLIGARECKADYAASVRGIMPLRPWGDEPVPPCIFLYKAYFYSVFGIVQMLTPGSQIAEPSTDPGGGLHFIEHLVPHLTATLTRLHLIDSLRRNCRPVND